MMFASVLLTVKLLAADDDDDTGGVGVTNWFSEFVVVGEDVHWTKKKWWWGE